MRRSTSSNGFSLVELLLVLAIIGIIAGIAIPTYTGQRRRAAVVGDAMANCQVLRMALEERRATTGTYGPQGTYEWKADGSATSGSTLLPGFQPQGASKMNYQLVIPAGGVTYTLTAIDPTRGNVTAYQTNQDGKELARLK